LKKISRSGSSVHSGKSTSRECASGQPQSSAVLSTASLGNAAPANRGAQPLVNLRPYQQPVFYDRSTGLVILHWSRQIGKSFTLGAWAVDRLLTQF